LIVQTAQSHATYDAAKITKIFGELFGQELKGNKATELRVLGLVNHPHPAPPSFSTMW